MDGGLNLSKFITNHNHRFNLWKFRYEREYEDIILQHAGRIFEGYWACRFNKPIFSERFGNKKADLVLISKNYHHWVVVEVEFAHHDLRTHVLPQVLSFKYGEYKESHAEYICDRLIDCELEKLSRLIAFNQPDVLVIVDQLHSSLQGWVEALHENGVKFSSALPFKSSTGEILLEYEGWFPEKPSTPKTRATWDSSSMFLSLDVPAAVIHDLEEEYILTLEGRPSRWKPIELLDTISLIPLERSVVSLLTKTSYTLAIEADTPGELVFLEE